MLKIVRKQRHVSKLMKASVQHFNSGWDDDKKKLDLEKDSMSKFKREEFGSRVKEEGKKNIEEKAKESKTERLKKEILSNPEFFQAFPHLKSILTPPLPETEEETQNYEDEDTSMFDVNIAPTFQEHSASFFQSLQ